MPFSFRRAIRQAMEAKGMTVTELAIRAKVSRPNLTNFVNGKRQLRSNTLERIFEVLHLDVRERDVRNQQASGKPDR